MWESVLTDKRLESRSKLNIFRCCISPAREGVGLFSHARDNIYISSWRCGDFLVLAHFFLFVSLSIYHSEEKTEWVCLTDTHRVKRTPMCTHAEPFKCATLVLSPL